MQFDGSGGGLGSVPEFTCRDGIPDFTYRRLSPEQNPDRPEYHHEPRPFNIWCARPNWHPIPFTGLAYSVKYGGMLQYANAQFGLERLAGVRQFDWKASLYDPQRKPFDRFRYGHSFDAAAIANLICDRNAHALDMQTRRTTAMVSLLHDILMPAGGDTVKGIACDLDEDRDFDVFIKSDAYWEACCRYDLAWEGSIPIAKEESAAGIIKDIADKIAYVSRDAACVLHACRHLSDEEIGEIAEIRAIIRRRPDVCAVWEDVTVQGDQIVITDISRLADFLTLRALMFKLVYQHPDTRTGALVINYCILEHLFRTGQLTVQQLRTMRDEDIDRDIIDRYAHKFGLLECRREQFADIEAAMVRKASLLRKGVIFSFLEDFRFLPGYATNYLVPSPLGPRPFRLMYPEMASSIEQICNESRGVRLTYLPQFHGSLLPGLLEAVTNRQRADLGLPPA